MPSKKLSLKEVFLALDDKSRVTDRYGKRLRELDLESTECIKNLVNTSNSAVEQADSLWKNGATPQVLQESDSTVIHIRRAREAVENLPALCSRLR
jgi:hypothetical protein